MYEGSRADRIDFYNEIDWQSTNALLKAEFPLSVSNPEATYDLGIGSVKRGNNTQTAYEVYAQYWADLTDANGSYGVSVLNDSKYGWDKPNDHTIRLTLLHTPETKGGYVLIRIVRTSVIIHLLIVCCLIREDSGKHKQVSVPIS